MTALLLQGGASGAYSSRRMAKAAVERADFMMIVAGDPPDFRTILECRRRHPEALAGLFVQVLKLAERARLVKLGHVALDGTKIKANASKHKAMSYERMQKREAELAAEVNRWLKAADREEDPLHGHKRGDELPGWVADKEKRLEEVRRPRGARRTAAGRRRPRRSPTARGSATSPILRAASSRPRTATSKAQCPARGRWHGAGHRGAWPQRKHERSGFSSCRWSTTSNEVSAASPRMPPPMPAI
jgi:hypothetical protein